tara:strand:- start:2717 stop:3199 length:483 start_codon:yes stop_codon:yes gene_type:complete
MNTEITDNFLESDLIKYLSNYFILCPQQYGHSSNGKGNLFYSTNLDVNNPLYNFLCMKVGKLFLNHTEILRMYINVQYCFMNGSFHADDGDHTVLLMITPTLKKNSGEFHIKENNKKLKKISFVQNRLIKFPSLWEHKGCSPTEKNTPRITLVFKTRKHN